MADTYLIIITALVLLSVGITMVFGEMHTLTKDLFPENYQTLGLSNMILCVNIFSPQGILLMG